MCKLIPLLLLFLSLEATSERVIRGQVQDKNTGEPIKGVVIIELGTTNGATSDSLGNFSLALKKKSEKVLFSHIAYTPMHVDISKKDEPLSIHLEREIYSYGTIDLDYKNIEALLAQKLICPEFFQQSQTINGNTVFTVVEAREEYPGKLNCFNQVFAESFYPYLRSEKIERFGELHVFFTVSKEGKAVNVRVDREVSKELLFIVSSTFQKLRFWKPAEQNGNYTDIELGCVLKYD